MFSFIAGLFFGWIISVFVARFYKIFSKKNVDTATVVDQRNATADGDIVGRDKISF